MIFSNDHLKTLPWLPERTILLVAAGSHAYGLNTPSSDIDMAGVCIAPAQYYTGFLNTFQQAQDHNPECQSTIYNLPRIFALAAECNPNIIEILFAEEGKGVYQISSMGRRLLGLRELFLSKKARFTFSGYAIAQLKRIRTHRKWLLDPPKKKPERADFKLPETAVLSKDIIGAITAIENTPEAIGLSDQFSSDVMAIYSKERQYHNATMEWTQYQSWKKNRNEKRAATEAQYGYDTKHAMHLVRLMRMCEEIMQGKGVIVRRTDDREELLAIRSGAWSYDQLMEFVEANEARLGGLYEKSDLPREVNRVRLDEHCRAMVEEMNWPEKVLLPQA